ncbi:SNF2 family N-terminal domain-containing protein [Pelagophyceae sp. CCMP2097]|nr:SNF2 family N-terminal domain-containing protein [Pelagophyceae sp. CCMP2097]
MLRKERGGGGGLLCDEPGMGKTLTVIALLLKTARLRGEPSTPGAAKARGRPARRSSGGGARSDGIMAVGFGAVPAAALPAVAALPSKRRGGGTLIVVPTALVEHWRAELKRRSAGSRGAVDAGASPWGASSWHDSCLGRVVFDAPCASGDCAGAVWTAANQRGDSAWGDAPDVYVVSDHRVSVEYRRLTDANYGGAAEYESSLLRCKWLRCVVDEGQHAGLASRTNLGLLLSKLDVERRWIMTGTPTSLAGAKRGEQALKQLGRLLATVNESPCENVTRWGMDVVSPLVRPHAANAAAADVLAGEARRLCAEDVVLAACRAAMVRHTVEDLQLPPPVRVVTLLEMASHEAQSYNAFVSFILGNLLLTAMDGGDAASMRDGRDVSLLNEKNRKSALEAIHNIRLTCAGGGEMVPTAGPGVLEELIYLLRERHAAPPQSIEKVVRYFAAGELRSCDVCGMELSYLLVTPCCHLLCPECVRPGHVGCAACGEAFAAVRYRVSDDSYQHPVDVSALDGGNVPYGGDADVDFSVRCRHVYGWAGRGASESARTCTLQHRGWREAYMQGVDAFVWLQPGMDLRWREAMQERAAADAAQEFWRNEARRATASVEGRGAETASASVPVPAAVENNVSDLTQFGKAYHVVRALERALEAQQMAKRRGDGVGSRPVRCIVFDEQRKILDWVGHYLVLRFGDDAVAQFWGTHRDAELQKFAKGTVRSWRCACGFDNEDPSAKTCARRVLKVRLDGAPVAFPPVAVPPAVFGGMTLGGARVDAAEDDVLGHAVGRVYTVGQRVFLHGVVTRGGVVAAVGRCGLRRTRDDRVRALPYDGARILLLSTDGRHGLDLPFVTHIFLLSTIWEPTVERQVVSRACRIGATGPVTVDQLVMRGTAEEHLYRMATGTDGADDAPSKIHRVLKGLKLLRPTVRDTDAAENADAAAARESRVPRVSLSATKARLTEAAKDWLAAIGS